MNDTESAEKKAARFRAIVDKRQMHIHRTAELNAELVKLAYEINRERLHEAFPGIEIQTAGVSTLKASDSGGTVVELIEAMEKEGVKPQAIIADPMRFTVTVLYGEK